jgi:type VI secretion system secreted protein VgrG
VLDEDGVEDVQVVELEDGVEDVQVVELEDGVEDEVEVVEDGEDDDIVVEEEGFIVGIEEGVDGLVHDVDGFVEGVDGLVHGVDGLVEGVDGLVHGVDGLVEGVDGLAGGLDGLGESEGFGRGITTLSLLNTLLIAFKSGYFSPHFPLKSSVSIDQIIPPANCIALMYCALIVILSTSSYPTHCLSL